MRSLVSLLMLASAGLMAGGCATAGLAIVGPLAGSVTAIVDRSVERTLPADLSTTWVATADALERMAVRIEETDRSGAKWRLTGTGGATTVHGTLERVTAGMTSVSVRVEAGGLLADKKTGDELLNQIAASLAGLANAGRRDGTASSSEASVDQLRALQQEIQRLGTRIEQTRVAPSPTARSEAASVPAPSQVPIITIPASAGVATVPVPETLSTRPAIPSALRPSAGPRNTGALSQVQTAEHQEGRAEDILAAPMRSAEVLRPVEGLGTRPSSE